MNSPRSIDRLPGMADLYSAEIDRRDKLVRTLQESYELRGYQRVDTPLLEQTELFIRKSGGDLSSRLYGFKEPGGYEVSLRPEFTAPVLRFASKGRASEIPARYQYAGPVFRYPVTEPGGQTERGEFWQLGAELIGPNAPAADGEIIAMAMEGLALLDAPESVVKLGDVGMVWQALQPFGLSQRAILFMLNSIGDLRQAETEVHRVRKKARDMGLTGNQPTANGPPILQGGSDRAPALVESVLGEASNANSFFAGGSRSKEEIAERLARKLTRAEDPARFDAALDLLGKLASLNGPPAEVFDKAEDALKGAGQTTEPLENLMQVVEAAICEGVPREAIRLDLGLARGILYYTGVIFDAISAGRPVGGGGRYDGLTRALGAKQDLPSLGFAFNLHAISEVIPAGEIESKPEGSLVVARGREAAPAAAREAARLRQQGSRATLDFNARSDLETLRPTARSAGYASIVAVAADGAIQREDLL